MESQEWSWTTSNTMRALEHNLMAVYKNQPAEGEHEWMQGLEPRLSGIRMEKKKRLVIDQEAWGCGR